MSNYESEVERHAGVDMVPVGESFEWNPGPDNGAPILRPDFNLKVPNPVATPSGTDWSPVPAIVLYDAALLFFSYRLVVAIHPQQVDNGGAQA
jgi:hypothetical protein